MTTEDNKPKPKPKLKPKLKVNIKASAARAYDFERISKSDTRKWGNRIAVKRKERVKNLSRSFRLAEDQVEVLDNLKEKYEVPLSRILDMMIDFVQDDMGSFEDYVEDYLAN